MAYFSIQNSRLARPQTQTVMRVMCGIAVFIFTISMTAAQSPFEERHAGNNHHERKTASQRVNVVQNLLGIKIEGNVSIPRSTIMPYIKSHPQRPANPAQVKKDISALYGTGWFSSVRSTYRMKEKGPLLVFQVVESPIVKKVEYRGNKKIKDKHLAANTGLKRGSAFNIHSNKDAVSRLEKFYHEKGFFFAKVKLIKGDRNDDREVIFRINEGPKVRVTKIKFTGNKFFRDSVLKLKMKTKTAILWKFSGLYNPETIPEDIVALKEYYHSLGFFDVRIKQKVSFTKGKGYVTIEYKIKEGIRYKLRKVEYIGNNIFSSKQLSEESKLRAGDYFDTRKMTKDVAAIKDRYGKLGRLFATVQATPRFLETPGQADLELRINEDKVYIIRKIDVNIRGDQTHTKRSVALNAGTISPGDLADPKEIMRSKARIEGLQIFERGGEKGVQIHINRVEKSAQKKPVFRGQNKSFPRSYPRRKTAPPVRRKLRKVSPRYRTQRTTRRRSVFRGQSEELANPFEKKQNSYRAPANPFRENNSFRENNRVSTRTAPSIQRRLRTSSRTTPRSSSQTIPYHSAVGSEAVPQPYQTIQQQSHTDDLGLSHPVNPLFETSPQGDLYGDTVRQEYPNLVDIIVEPTEARTGRLMFGVGVNSDAGVVGSIVLDERNFDLFRPPRTIGDLLDGNAWRGAGQRFRIEAVPGSQLSRYMVNWSDPYVFDTNYSLGLSGFFFSRFYDDWTEQRLGGRISIGRQFTPFFSLNASLRLEQVEVSNPRVPTPPELAASVGEAFLSTIKLNATYDQRDSSFLPSEGYILRAGYEQAFGDFSYPRFNAKANTYWTVRSRHDGAGKHIVSLGGEIAWTGDDTPIFENYFAGGFSTFRGFDFRGIGPDTGGVKTGGKFMALGSVEYRFPLMANEMFHGVVFSDFGTVENDVALDNFRVTVGAGVRIMVPAMGPVPLAFDFAVPLTSLSSDERRLFSFYMGFTK
ncbi:Outer membrane protein assembly factor YaeT [hydrothermal vent metagenome]|uniref:Outer membrane protein assembly factor YaeT n=1 Tax=hydrothermal vent metagenome TaxID=652676 RepID=A0A3B1DG72_9ZZZZ